jgi:HPt (histidine-containing phosphotransfer) domain-containing protein
MIDWIRVRELRDEIGEDDLAEVVDLFLDEADEVAKNIGNGLAPEEVEAALHFLKGSALNLGFRKLAELCQIGEKEAARGRAETVNLEAVVTAYERSKRAFAAGEKAEDAA